MDIEILTLIRNIVIAIIIISGAAVVLNCLRLHKIHKEEKEKNGHE